MKRLHWLAITIAAVAVSTVAQAQPLRIATWNLGWHVARTELPGWIMQCNKLYLKNKTTKVWDLVPEGTTGAKRGWEVTESRAKLEGVDLANMPPCAVYQANFKGVAVTANAYAKRDQQIAQLLERDVRPDVIAFQEVSGQQAVMEALGNTSQDYNICSFDGKYKIQRLAFAWRKTFGGAVEPCQDIADVSLPQAQAENQVRPAYTVTLDLHGKKVRFLTVHLKSSCVSPLDTKPKRLDDDAEEACVLLQQQVQPLEDAFEKLGQGVDHFVVLGDFNRNLGHELAQVKGADAVRSDKSTDLTRPRAANIKTRNLLLEINDGHPATSKAILLKATCPGSAEVQAACDAVKTSVLTQAQLKLLQNKTALGCRNPVGLDHILVSQSLTQSVSSTVKISLGAWGGSLQPTPTRPDPLLATSDHCPLVAEITF